MKTKSIICLLLTIIITSVSVLSLSMEARAASPAPEEAGEAPSEESNIPSSEEGGMSASEEEGGTSDSDANDVLLPMEDEKADGETKAPDNTGKTLIQSISADLEPVCGAEPESWSPDVSAYNDETYLEDAAWAEAGVCTKADGSAVGDAFLGGVSYAVELIIYPETGYYFDDSTVIDVPDEISCSRSMGESGEIILTYTAVSEHVNDWDDSYESQSSTCVAKGYEQYVCAGCGEKIRTESPVDPTAHEWGDWVVEKEATTTQTGSKNHTCKLCGETVTVTIPRKYASVFEPNTSWAMSATIAWETDASALNTAKAAVRPDTAFVWLDSSLKVFDRSGKKLSDDLDSYVKATSATMIPAFYIKDKATASALKTWLKSSGLEDCFVVAAPENKALVKDVADLLHVRGMLDYSSVKSADRKALLDMIASVNGAHGKVVILSSEAATRENIQLLQSLCATVWVKTDTDTKTIVTHYTNGVNGVLVDDYKKAVSAMELFNDDAPSLLRVPLIIGHRGDPSNYVENTLDSAKGAFDEGADSIENDIYLSKDCELYIRHDDNLYAFIGKASVNGETLTLAELKELVFNWDDESFGIRVANEVPWYEDGSTAYGRIFGGKLYGEEEKKAYTIPALSEYLNEFKGKKIVHDTEIKSRNPEIVAVLKKLVDSRDAWDQVFTITFEENILEEIYKNYPEISVGALMAIMPYDHDNGYITYEEVENGEGPEASVERLCGHLDQWNATYNPAIIGKGNETIRAARHRGLTVWPWTYDIMTPDDLAEDYLRGMNGLTVDEPWFASDYIEEIASADVTALKLSDVAKPKGTAKNGKTKTLSDAEIVELEDLNKDGTQKLVIWRYKADLTIDGKSYGKYYLYSNPFVFTTKTGEWTFTKFTCEKDKDGFPINAKAVYTGGPSGSETKTVDAVLTKTKDTAESCTKDGTRVWKVSVTASKSLDKKAHEEKDFFTLETKATGHDFGEPEYEWAEDNSSVTATRICKKCGEKETETVKTTSGISKEATETEEGEMWYTAEFENPAFEIQTKTVPIEKKGVKGLYFFDKGDGNKYKKGTVRSCDFTIKRSEDDETTFDHFKGIKVDGKDVDETNYIAKSGSVIIKIKASYMKLLKTGDHTLTVNFDDGEAEGKFTVYASSSGGSGGSDKDSSDKNSNSGGSSKKNSNKNNSGSNSKNSGNKKGANPKTGDDNNPILWILLLLASGGCAGWLLIQRKRKSGISAENEPEQIEPEQNESEQKEPEQNEPEQNDPEQKETDK